MTEQRAAVVAGAGRGIGATVVRRLSADGWAVIAADRYADDLDVPCPLAHPRQLAAAHRGLWGLAGYCTAKHAVLGMVRGLACYLRGTGVAAMAVSPGSTRTGMLHATAALCDLDDCGELAEQQLVGRLLEPDEIAQVVASACSPPAGALTGSVLHADGGFTG